MSNRKPTILKKHEIAPFRTTSIKETLSTFAAPNDGHLAEKIPNQNPTLKWVAACIYVISGCTQPLLLTLAQISGLGDKMCQLYMLFYCLGPALVSFASCSCSSPTTTNRTKESYTMMIKAGGIAVVDIATQTINYSGATMAGPTIFSIIYSSIIIWTAVYSRILLGRKLNAPQWVSIFIVFGGLAITALHSSTVGPDVFKGAILVLVGSSLHAMTYVLSEAVMVTEDASKSLSVETNCAVQGVVATCVSLSWQFIYTRRHFKERILLPMSAAGTSIPGAICILLGLTVSNLAHGLSYFYTLKHFPGGATSAGVMKGLQAVFVFLFTSIVYCGSIGGDEMCFSTLKCVSLLIVISGVLMFMKSTELDRTNKKSGEILRNGRHSIVETVGEQKHNEV